MDNADDRAFFPDKPHVHLGQEEICAVFTAHNEEEKIPFFLEYYRDLGVTRFFAIDNSSTDSTPDILQAEDDVVYFHTDHSYAKSAAGRYWTTELARHYAKDRWVLTLDLDELLVYPGIEMLDLPSLCRYLDDRGFDALFTIFLDMYSNRPLSRTIYEPGQSFIELCSYFDSGSYRITAAENFPPIQIKGGPRQRLFWQQGGAGGGPAMRKLPLVKWNEDIDYLMSTHSMKPAMLADITGATLHFKFFSSFKELVSREVERGDRRQPKDYEKYKEYLDASDPLFFSADSILYENSNTLLERGFMVSSKEFERFLRFNKQKPDDMRGVPMVDNLAEAARFAEENAKIDVAMLPAIWPMVTSQARFEFFDVRDGKLYGWLSDRSFSARPKFQIWIDGEEVAELEAGHLHLENTGLSREIETSMFCYDFGTIGPDAVRRRNIEIFDVRQNRFLGSVSVSPDGNNVLAGDFDGVVHDSEGPLIRGWAFDKWSRRPIDITIYRDDLPFAKVKAVRKTPYLKKRLNRQSMNHGFRLALREHSFTEGSRFSVGPAMSSSWLRRSPLIVDGQDLVSQTRLQAMRGAEGNNDPSLVEGSLR